MLIWNVQYQQKQLQVIQCKNCSGVQNQEEYMKLVLKNIGKVQNATVEINGITVIAGENDTGKSTVGKALFSVFNSLYNIDEKITAERERSVFNQLQAMSREAPFGDYIHISPSELIKEINTVNEKKLLEMKLKEWNYLEEKYSSEICYNIIFKHMSIEY